jgi:hypothetical protein
MVAFFMLIFFYSFNFLQLILVFFQDYIESDLAILFLSKENLDRHPFKIKSLS